MKSTDVHAGSDGYEAWLSKHTRLIPADLEFKHQEMKRHAFPFLRATFYRWVDLWPEVCPDLQDAPRVLAVGDLHVENFGSWRDSEGRLVWGINDFDEAWTLPYTSDLARLGASALLAAELARRDGRCPPRRCAPRSSPDTRRESRSVAAPS